MVFQRIKLLVASVTAAVVMVCSSAGLAYIANAEPANPTDTLAKLRELSHQSEQTNEALHNAQIDLDAKIVAQQVSQAKQESDNAALAQAQAQLTQFQGTVDQLVLANYKGARTNRLYAVLISDSPQQLLDQMSALDIINNDTKLRVEAYRSARANAEAAQRSSRLSADAARIAAEQAQSLRADLQNKQSELQVQIAQVKAVFASLTDSQMAAFAGPSVNFDLAALPPGTGAAKIAVQAALSRVGSPYVWGGTGPNSFDCSGLVVWSYRQAGQTLPRSSQAQAQAGTKVSLSDLQPGDVITYYEDASHVALYIGDGYVVHAPTFGVPVKVVPIAGAGPVNDARRF
ncbi:MAG: NlpC/P60 family protein [Mycobacteriaceae bacterium]